MNETSKLFGHKILFSNLIYLDQTEKFPNKILLNGPKGIGKKIFLSHLLNYLCSKNNEQFYNLKNNEYDGIILAKAGIKSLDLGHLISQEFSTNEIIPSAGQGVVSIQCREDDKSIINLLDKINDEQSCITAKSERKVLNILEGDCHTPVGVFSKVNGDNFEIIGELFSIDGKKRYFKKINDKVSNYFNASIELGNYLKSEAEGNYKK